MSAQPDSRNPETAARTPAPTHLIVGTTPQAEWRTLLPLMEAAGCRLAEEDQLDQWRAKALGDARKPYGAAKSLIQQTPAPAILPVGDEGSGELLESWVRDFDETLLLVFHTRPEKAIERAMAQGEEPDAALRTWSKAAERLLAVVRRNRRRVRVFDVDCARAAPEAFSQECEHHLGLMIPPTAVGVPTKSTEPENALHHLIANQAVMQTPDAQDLASELEASSLPIAESGKTLAVDVAGVYRNFEHRLQTEKLERENLESSVKQAVDQTTEANNKLEAAESRARELEEESELLLMQLHQVQEELETYYLEARDLQEQVQKRDRAIEQKNRKLKEFAAKNRKLNKQLDDKKKRISNIARSTSWRLTLPLRVFKRLLGRLTGKRKG